MAIEIGDVIRAVVDIAMPDEVDAINIWDWVRTDSQGTNPTNSVVTLAIAAKLVDVYGEIQADLSDLVTVVSATNYQMGFDAGRWIVDRLLGVEAIGVQGTATSEMLPHGVAGLITMPTSYSRRRGRRFFPGFNENSVSDGIFSSGVVTSMLAAATEYNSPITVSSLYTLTPRLLSKDGNTYTFTALAADGTPSYQRRRKPGVGS